jgi:hypothetical protein
MDVLQLHRLARHHEPRRRLLGIVLLEEGGDHLGRRRAFRVRREEAAVADVAPDPDHDQVDAGDFALDDAGDDVGVDAAVRLDVLPYLDARQRAHLVTVGGGLLILSLLGSRMHLFRQAPDDIVLPAFQEERGVVDVLGIDFGRDLAGAWGCAALDLVQQAGTRAVLEHRVLAGAQLEHALQELDALAHCVGVGKRTEIAMALVLRSAVEAEARKLVPGDCQVGIGLVVAKKDVVARREALDEIVLEQQRLSFGARRRHLDRRHLPDHHLGARSVAGLVEVGGDALLQVARLADIERFPALAEHAVDARETRQPCDERFCIEHAEFIIKRVKCAPFSRRHSSSWPRSKQSKSVPAT